MQVTDQTLWSSKGGGEGFSDPRKRTTDVRNLEIRKIQVIEDQPAVESHSLQGEEKEPLKWIQNQKTLLQM